MLQICDPHFTSDEFDFQMTDHDMVQFSFGSTRIGMTLDLAYDLQYQLAAFLAQLEIQEYPEEVPMRDLKLRESKQILETLTFNKKSRRLDS